MLHTKIVDSKKEKILTSNAEKFIKDSKFGASIYFLGTVRNINDNKTVTGITYDSHDEMVIKSFEEIYNEADQKLDIKDKAVFIEHAKGHSNCMPMVQASKQHDRYRAGLLRERK